ncbi:CMP-sialic acid transporter 3 [Linum perenne]
MKNAVIECSVCRSKLLSPAAKTVSRAYDRHKSRVSSKQRALNVLLVVGDCMLVGLSPILVYMSKVDGKFEFSPVSVNFLTEITKVVFAIVMLILQARRQKVGEKPLLSISSLTQAARNNVLLAVPAFLYAINNYLKFTMQLYFNPATVKMLSNLKVLVIAVLLKFVMKRRFSIIQWEALALLLIGISINQLRSLPEGGGVTAMGIPIATSAYMYTFIFVTVPSLASVYNEYALKSQYDTSIYLQNLFLYGYGAIFNFLAILAIAVVKGPNSMDILHGHSKATMLLICNNAAQGILSSFFFKYADTILKKYSSTVATIFTGIASAAMFGHKLTMNFVLGISIVFISMHQFFSPLSKVKDEPPNVVMELKEVAEDRRSKEAFINIAAGANEEVSWYSYFLILSNIRTIQNPPMSSANTLRFSPLLHPRFLTKSPTIHPPSRLSSSIRCSFSTTRRRSRRSDKRKLLQTTTSTTRPSLIHNDDDLDHSTSSQNLQLVLDLDQLSSLASSNLRKFISSGKDAYRDLKTLVSYDENNRIVFSCRKSTVRFSGMVLLGGFVLVTAVRVLVSLVLAIRRRVGFRREKVVVRRDRSLGGKEVVVATAAERDSVPKRKRFGVLDDPLSSLSLAMEGNDWGKYLGRRQDKLPKWWPVTVADNSSGENQEEYQREAKRLIREITDYRTRGKDFAVDDIVQLRRICRTSGVKVSFDTTNTRDALFRALIDFVLNMCSSNPSNNNALEIDGEGVQQFISGLAENIGLENTRAARIVSAAVAARTHSCFLQAWPEMEMVAEGLGKHLKMEQREALMAMFVAACSSKDCHRIAADALGLVCSSRVYDSSSSSILESVITVLDLLI